MQVLISRQRMESRCSIRSDIRRTTITTVVSTITTLKTHNTFNGLHDALICDMSLDSANQDLLVIRMAFAPNQIIFKLYWKEIMKDIFLPPPSI